MGVFIWWLDTYKYKGISIECTMNPIKATPGVTEANDDHAK